MVLEALQQHGNDNDGGGNGAVQEGGDVRSGEDVGDDAEHQNAHEGAYNFATAAGMDVPPIATAAMASISKFRPALEAATAVMREA